MTIKAILACDDKGGVGKDGTLPWPNISRDFHWFKEHTKNHVVVMGSSTWEDPHMPCPLPNRINVVATNQDPEQFDCDGIIKGDLVKSIKTLENMYPDKTIWVIGGPKIIEQALGVIDKFYISRIPGDYDCDSFLPLKKIETLFFKDWEEEFPEVKFEIWNKGQL